MNSFPNTLDNDILAVGGHLLSAVDAQWGIND